MTNRDRLLKSFDRLRKVPLALAETMNDFVRAEAARVRDEAPVEEGDLARSVHAVEPSNPGDRATWSVISDSPHAGAVEYGTRDIVANPFFRRAVAGGKARLDAAIRRGVHEAL